MGASVDIFYESFQLAQCVKMIDIKDIIDIIDAIIWIKRWLIKIKKLYYSTLISRNYVELLIDLWLL